MHEHDPPRPPAADPERTDALPVLTDVSIEGDFGDDAVPLEPHLRPAGRGAGAARRPSTSATAPLRGASPGDELERLRVEIERLRDEIAERDLLITALRSALAGPLQGGADASATTADALPLLTTEAEAVAATVNGAAASGEPAWALVRLDQRTEQSYALGRRSHIGRAASCEIWIDSPSVSRHHALVIVDAQGAVIEDLHSTNGSYLNGRKVVRERLRDGDLLSLGEIRFRVTNPPDPAP